MAEDLLLGPALPAYASILRQSLVLLVVKKSRLLPF
jgi:hypothetical protein